MGGAGSFSNALYGNVVSNNCGDGIVITDNAHNNSLFVNTARYNAFGSNDGRCAVAVPGTFFDLAQDKSGPMNFYSPNNICRTQSAGIPAGVCNPGE